MSDRFFLDTNIFVYSFDQSAPAKRQMATQWIREARSTQKGIVSYQVVQEFFNVALQRFAAPMSLPQAELYFKTVFLPLLGVQSSQALYLEALDLFSTHRLSWYDALIVASAKQAKCSILLTADLQHGRSFGDLRIENPFLKNAE